MKKVFISGKMTGLTPEQYQMRFDEAACRLRTMGYEVFDPAEGGWIEQMKAAGQTYGEVLIETLKRLRECDAIYMLSNWKDSKGATVEHAYAEAIGMEMMYE